MSCQYNLLFLFLCGFTALSVSTDECGKDLLVGTSCIIKLKTKNTEKPYEVKWVHDYRNGDILRWKDGNIKTIAEGLSMEDDGSLRFKSLHLSDTGKYTFYAQNTDGTEIGRGEVEIKVYEKAPKPTVRIKCTPDGNATLTCDIGDRKDLKLSWYKDDKPIQNEKPQLLLSSTQVQENKPYLCEASNPLSKEKSESITASFSTETCGKDLLVGTSCIIKLPVQINDDSQDIKWTHSSSGAVIQRKNKKKKSNTPGLTMEDDGSIKFQNVSLKDTGVYTYSVFSPDGIEIHKGKEEIKVYEKAPKPTVRIKCTADGNATLTCDIGNRKDLTLSWYKDDKPIQNEKPQLLLSSTQVQENKPYSCEASNPVSREKSESITAPCRGRGLGLGILDFGIIPDLGTSEKYCLK